MSVRLHRLLPARLRWIALFVLSASAPALAQVDTSETRRDRSDVPATTPRIPLSPFETEFPYGSGYGHRVELDSTTMQVRIYETLFGQRIGQPRAMSFDDFVAERQRETERRMWEERARKYELNTTAGERDELEKILGSGTQIDIPIPQNPLTSIFGSPTISINVNGSVNVSAGWQWDDNNLTGITDYGSTQSAPFFNQNIQVNVSGRVGELLKLNADFDNQRTLDLENQMKISFGGGPESDDNIIQSVEAGNVSLQSPSSLIGGSQTLFGAKASFKFGKLFLTALASQKRGERKTVNVAGGSVKQQICIKPYDYAINHFWLADVYRNFYDEYFRSTPPAATPAMAPFTIRDIEVYEQVKDGSIPAQFRAIAYADLPAADAAGRYSGSFSDPVIGGRAGEIQRGSFKKLTSGTDFEIDRQLGTLTIRSLQADKMYAVAYRTADSIYGEFANTRPDNDSATVVLKLVYVPSMQPEFRSLWRRQMKNIYPLQGVRNVDVSASKITITYGVPPDTSAVLRTEGNPRLVTVLGVDRVNNSGDARPDGEFDIRSQYIFDPANGRIVFPSTEPFRRQLQSSLGANAEPYVLDAIYDQTRDEAQRDTRVGKYAICGEIAGSGGSKISLGAFYLAPNSIKVFSNGQALAEGVDYRVDAVFGEVTLLSPRANSPTANISVEYEQNDFATIANKTLVGLRGDYDLLNKRYVKSKLGMTFMRYGQSLPTDKVQIYSNDESVANTMLGFDGFIDYQANFLTRWIDAIPLIDTKEPSTLRLSGEWAMVMPNPDTKPSLVADDGGLGAAYIDDFESGAKRQIQLGVNYTSWFPASPPADPRNGIDDEDRLAHKGHMWWYNTTGLKTTIKEIWQNKDPERTASATTVLDLVYDPARRGIYNTNVDYESQYNAGGTFRDMLWGGMMRSLSFYASNLNEENIDYIEITMKVETDGDVNRHQSSKMFIDLGQISEDVIPNFKHDTEDGITPNNTQQDDVLNEGEDVGIDALADAVERQRFPSLGDDPSHDNHGTPPINATPFDYNQEYDLYGRVNGQEGNLGPQQAPRPDAEDLDGNKSVDLDNSYFTYEVNLDFDALRNAQIVGGGDNPNGWRTYRIPLRTGFQKTGNPSFSNVKYVRVRLESNGRPLKVRIAEFNLVGSDWRNYSSPIDSARDPKLDIAFVSIEDNGGPPDFYLPPPGVEREPDAVSNTLKNEQSLSVSVKDLDRGETRAAIRVRPRAFDVFNYKKMKFFLHGGGDMDAEQIGGQPAKVIAYMRFGWDSLNYYEYRVPLLQGWNGYTVDFDALAAIKQERGSTTGNGIAYFPVPDGNGGVRSGEQFAVRGLPSLTRVQFISFGILNNAYPGALTTTMWVNELRVIGAENSNDWAAKVSAAVKLADLGNVSFNAERFNPNFHRLEDRFGNRVESSNWAMNSVFQLEKFVPESFKGTTIPLTYNHIERIEKPRYIAQSDVEVDAAVQRLGENQAIPADVRQRRADSLRLASQTLVVQDGFALQNVRIAWPGQVWWVRDIFNRLTFGYDYRQTRQRSPQIDQRFEWQWQAQAGYQVPIPRNFDVQPFKKLFEGIPLLEHWKDFRVNFLPNNFAASSGVTRSRTTEQLRDALAPSPVVRDFRATRAAQFTWPLSENGLLNITTDYNVDVSSSLTHLETNESGLQREGADIAKDLFFNEGRLFNFGRDNNLRQTFTFNSRPRLPLIPDRFFRITTARYYVQYQWLDELATNLQSNNFTKSAQWTSTATLGAEIPLMGIGNALWGDKPSGGRDTTKDESGIASVLRYLIKVPLLEFERLSFNYKQDNTSKNPGVVGSTGVSNLWGRSLLFRSESPDFGPGAAYQLGLINDPHGELDFGFKSAFPFITFEKNKGVRAPNIYVLDNYTQKNNLTASTSRALWQGASLSINWGVDWGINKSFYILTDGNGVYDSLSNVLTTGNLNRTYLSLPDVFGFTIFDNDIEGVVNEYARRKAELAAPTLGGTTQADTLAYNLAFVAYNRRITELLSETFEEQLESFNWLPKGISSYLPRMNWNFTWNGFEKLPFLSDWAQSASIRHAYTGRFVRNFRESDEGRVPETQTVTRGFSPLVQLTVTGKPDVFNGTATGSISYNTTTDFALVTAARSEISKELKSDLQTEVRYQRRGLKLPIFGMNLRNDVEFSFTFTYGRTQRKRFNLTDFRPEGNNDGATRISLRPNVRYSLSNTVTASAFLSYDATIPDEEGSRDIRRSTTKVGIDLRVGISGGR
ncbi:MAG TPA: cell surface protein SprA [Candidatus Kapabacteria bacterium]|nr:cell surface protein SprA [Candidatus Kapabacteria bacterium]